MAASLRFCFLILTFFPQSFAVPRRMVPALVRQYYVNWDGGMKACKGAENKIFNMEKLVVEKKNKTVLALVGDVNLTRSTTDKIIFILTIEKEVNGGFEHVIKIREENLCTHIAEQDKPWTPFVKEMGISGCPIPAKVYTFKESTVVMNKVFPMTIANAGNYRAEVELSERGVRTTCLIVYASVVPL